MRSPNTTAITPAAAQRKVENAFNQRQIQTTDLFDTRGLVQLRHANGAAYQAANAQVHFGAEYDSSGNRRRQTRPPAYTHEEMVKACPLATLIDQALLRQR